MEKRFTKFKTNKTFIQKKDVLAPIVDLLPEGYQITETPTEIIIRNVRVPPAVMQEIKKRYPNAAEVK